MAKMKLDPADEKLLGALGNWADSKKSRTSKGLSLLQLGQILAKILAFVFGEKFSGKLDADDQAFAPALKEWAEAKNTGKKSKLSTLTLIQLLLQFLQYLFENKS